MTPGDAPEGVRCPGREELRALAVGKLPLERLEELEVHLEDCPLCGAALQEIPDGEDRLLEELRHCGQGEESLPAAFPPLEPKGLPAGLIGDYEILEEVGRGGMGVVYKARQVRLNRTVALKVLRDGELATLAEVERFHQEALALAQLQHPNIVQVFDVGKHKGLSFFSLEYCPGGSLEQKLGGTPLPPGEAAALAETLARAVHAAHQARVIHRDLKPANVLLSADGIPKVTDFGLARRLEEAGQTGTGTVMGTASYMPPEQAQGRTKEIGPAADVYALGAVLYEFLTGRPPFKAANALDTLIQVVTDEPVPVRRLQPGVPRDLETICLQCLQKQPQRRYASAEALAEDLRRFQAGGPIQARPAGAAERALKWVRRRPLVAGLLAAVLLVAAVGIAAFAWSFDQVLEARGDAVREKDNTASALTRAGTNEQLAGERRRQAERVTLQARFDNLYFRSREEPDVALVGAAQLLPESPALPEQDLTASILLHLGCWSREVHPLRAVCAHPDRIADVNFSPDGKTVLTWSLDKAARLWDAATGKPIGPPLQHQGGVVAWTFSPDGKAVLTGGADNTARLWSAATGKQVGPPLQHQGTVRRVAFSPDGKAVLTGSDDKTAQVWEMATGRPLRPPLRHEGSVWHVAFSQDGRAVLTGSRDGTARVWEAATGKPLGPALPHEMVAVALSPDGQTVVTGSIDNGTARLWEVATGKPLGPPLRHKGALTGVFFSPDGKAVLTVSGEPSARLWSAATGQPLGPPMRHESQVMAVAFSPDGQAVLTGSGDKTARLWSAATGQPLGLPLRHQGVVMRVAFSPDGKAVLTGSMDKTARLWSAATGQPLGPPLQHGGPVGAVAFSPDGQTVLTGSDDGTARLWEAATGKQIGPPLPHQGRAEAVALSPDGQAVLTLSSDKTAQLREAATGKPLGPPLCHEGKVMAVAFSPDGRAVLTGSADGMARLWEAATGKQVGPPLQHGGKIGAVTFSPDGKALLTGSQDKTARLWQAATGKPIGPPLRHQADVDAVAFSPDCQVVLTVSWDKTRLWSATTGQPLGPLLRHPGVVKAAAFSPDGQAVLAVSDRDKTARLLEAATGKQIGPPLQHRDWVEAAAFSPDRQTVLTGSRDKTARLWAATTGKQLGPALYHQS
jgi:WD40 repeat protein/tRNA A-37 threonylcarbamoyl transferase component Bud32